MGAGQGGCSDTLAARDGMHQASLPDLYRPKPRCRQSQTRSMSRCRGRPGKHPAASCTRAEHAECGPTACMGPTATSPAHMPKRAEHLRPQHAPLVTFTWPGLHPWPSLRPTRTIRPRRAQCEFHVTQRLNSPGRAGAGQWTQERRMRMHLSWPRYPFYS
jgi:hypothetical protein